MLLDAENFAIIFLMYFIYIVLCFVWYDMKIYSIHCIKMQWILTINLYAAYGWFYFIAQVLLYL